MMKDQNARSLSDTALVMRLVSRDLGRMQALTASGQVVRLGASSDSRSVAGE